MPMDTEIEDIQNGGDGEAEGDLDGGFSPSIGKVGPVKGTGLKVLEELDCDSDSDGEPHKAQIPSKKHLAKDGYAGVRMVNNWAAKLSSSKPLQTLLSRTSTANSSRRPSATTSTKDSDSFIKGPRGTPISRQCSSTQASTTTRPPNSEDHHQYFDGDNTMEPKAASKTNFGGMMDIIEVDDDSTEMMPPPSRSQKRRTKLVKVPDAREDTSDDNILDDSLDSKEHEPTTFHGKGKENTLKAHRFIQVVS
ncbi:hypothetical protein PAXRUDRAFT_29118 [Paxillus rubicundulus Ve08.2h10]|uniref:Uncharacterized protein n=1 Tax=Paxillus rubicundulus Ve08.2h10 TaxID=930991 RepID=A0A0D0BU97_9AGAM|nr:hypothetical protein PAXRUDRAFT_29118 [Paxillus rubicundulus Ve08.2h10]